MGDEKIIVIDNHKCLVFILD
ncbi:hypothetical protein NVIE_2916 [Nitrososphaera viennensis EN76]|uniref:Uncharacterized protein n=1 Tax=Nitrososphaera viennensis EN76 TaxID=926571 RepID=A0A060HVP9_9ARCH|nr:hypothetical protein NVIE_2916 [Nitrososphaera viennensis EN76]